MRGVILPLISIFFILIVALFLLKITDFMSAYYINKAKPEVIKIATNISNDTGVKNNASDYDIYSKMKQQGYFQPLDVTLSIAVLASIAAVFIYVKQRT